MPYLLNLVYLALLVVLSPWLFWSAIRKGKYREGFGAKLLGLVPRRKGNQPCIWLHAVSVGEVNVLQPLVEQLRHDYPHCECVISTTTRTGYEIARKKFADLTVFYCPLDFSWSVRAALRRLRPDLLVLAELELWPNLIREAHARGTFVAVVNGRLSEQSARGYGRIRAFVRPLLRCIDLIAVQSEEYADRFIALGADPSVVQVTGSMKFDGAQTNRNNDTTSQLRQLAGISVRDIVFLAGSTQSPEEQLAVETFRLLKDEFAQLRLILVPRHPERFEEVAQLLDLSGLPWQRRSKLGLARDNSARILLVDSMGELSAWWGSAHIGFVGGSMGTRGGQSMIEPAAYGVATAFGPKTRNFRDVVQLMLRREAAVVVHDGSEMAAFVEKCLRHRDYTRALGMRAQKLVSEQLGATAKTTALLSWLLPDAKSRRRAA
ncbi:MAG: 3-deoxy-D-manno-octulosonic acid transferase [Planctomycetaceae bacterium]|nr:3-deoxy-D-manno-octulosonic acid transferase [Planctomycetales bacterium]MCB9921145.1 3-deoxy-D-manno-octulosonic acid transferase [Planctomycetaceae bacterium]